VSYRSYVRKRIEKLDLSGGPKSWFDLWHIHLPENAVDDPYRPTNKQDVLDLMQIYDEMRSALAKFTKAYQLFILIDENCYRENAVYIHTENPNRTPFPLRIHSSGELSLRSLEICAPLTELNWSVFLYDAGEAPLCYAYNSAIGVPLIQP